MRFGILGDAKIAREKLRPAIAAAGHQVTHIGRRDPSQGAHDLWGDVAVISYDDLLTHPDIDAIYNPLPNHLHVEMTIKALEAGKPVLCEKPIALSEASLDRLEEAIARTGLYVYDGFMVRHHPQWEWLRQIDIGKRKIVHAHFTYPPRDDGNVRNFAAYGGGPLWDIGCYCLLSGLLLFNGTPEIVGFSKEQESHLDVEMTGAGLIDFGNGQFLNFTVSSGTALAQSVTLIGSEGWASLDVPFNPPPITKAHFAKQIDGTQLLLTNGHEVVFEACDQYQLMIEDFVIAVLENRGCNLEQSRHIARLLHHMTSQ